MNMKNVSIAKKLPLGFVIVALVTAAITGLVAQKVAGDAVEYVIEAELVALREARSQAMTNYLDSIRQDLLIMAENQGVNNALKAFNDGWLVMEDKTASLQRLYITDNPNELGEKHLLDFAPDGSP